MSRNKDLIWPGMMLLASLTNVVGAGVAIYMGDANNSIAFKTGLATSIVYSVSHAVKVGQIIVGSRQDAELARRAVALEGVTIQR